MSEIQKKIWAILCELSGEEVARLLTDYHGNQLLSEGFADFIYDEGIIDSPITD